MDDNSFVFSEEITTVTHDASNMMSFENHQEDYSYTQNQSYVPQTVIKSYEDRLTRRLLLQHVTGLFINTINMKEIQIKKSLEGPNRYKHLFLEENIEIGSTMFIYERTSGSDAAATPYNDADINSFYILFIRNGNESVKNDSDDAKKRLMKIIQKRLPDVNYKFCWMLAKSCKNNIKNIQKEHDGNFIIKTDNIIGHGRYLLQNDESYRTTITYDLESPDEIGFLQNQFNITKQNSFYIMALNPLITMSSSHYIKFPENIQKIFKPSYQWAAGHTDIMDIEGYEMLLINHTVVHVQQLLDKLESETIEKIDSGESDEPDSKTTTKN
ncbi:hypothetical protein I4U23_017483 [Adineta vaga]|nr:hypothetical protein I4U23_017483 [Adineta vaga]